MIKDVLLVMPAHESGHSALDLAQAVAGPAGSVTCVCMTILPDGFLGYSESDDSGEAAAARREQHRYFEDYKDALQERASGVQWEEVETYPKLLTEAVAERARRADAVVVRAGAQSHETPHLAIIEAALFQGGAPVFVSPLHWHGGAPGKRVLVCWDGSREAARAARDALNFIAPDAQIVVATVLADPDADGDASGRALAAHLARGDIRAEARAYANTERGIAATLDHIAQEIDADLIVMGGYRRPRLQEAIFGGATRSFLHAPRVPLLLSH